MKVTVCADRRNFIVEVSVGDRVSNLKQKLHLRQRLEYIVLKFEGKILEDRTLLLQYHLKEGSKLCMLWKIHWRKHDGDELNEILMGFNDCLSDLRSKCAQSLHVLTRAPKRLFLKPQFIRTFLLAENAVFVTHCDQGRIERVQVVHKDIETKVPKDVPVIVSSHLEGGPCSEDAHIDIDPPCTIDPLTQIVSATTPVPDDQFVIKVRYADAESGADNVQSILIGDSETVGALKNVLREEHNVNASRIRLSVEGEEWRDGDVIRSLGVDSGATVTLTVVAEVATVGGSVSVDVLNCLSVGDVADCRTISVDRGVTVASLRRQLEAMFDIRAREYVLSLHGDEIMKPDKSLSTYGIDDGDRICISESLLVRYFATADNFSAKVNRYPFVPGDTVSDLKEKIAKKNNIDSRFINLNFDGDSLEDGRTLMESGVEGDSYLIMVSHLRGGKRFN